MGLSIGAQCRGEGVGYLLMVADQDYPELSAQVHTSDDMFVPSELFRVDSPSVKARLAPNAQAAWVVALPLLTRACVVEFATQGEVVQRLVFAEKRSKVLSRMLTTTKPEVAQTLRGYEWRYGRGRTEVRIDRVWPASDQDVTWRVHITFPSADTATDPALQVHDASGRIVDARIVCMEDHTVPSMQDPTLPVRLVTFSCTMPEHVAQFYAQASLGDNPDLVGFAGMNAARAHGMLADTNRMTAGAQADEAYTFWLEEHRATERELARQRTACATLADSERPLVSVVIPISQTTQANVTQTIASVVAQSYDRWELVIACDGTSDADLVALGIETEALPEHTTLAHADESTLSSALSAGIAQATGDYVALLYPNAQLEPDALWHMVQAIVKEPDADLLYSDEDELLDGRGHAPRFKTFPNYGALYTRDYVGNLLVLSRVALDAASLLGQPVSSHYDLVLRGFEVARSVVRVPKVLYHNRIGEQADATDEASAHEAGRQALQAHLDRRQIAARVEDGPMPCTYRVCYELSDPLPLVSVVIPTRDHADLLDTCVTSILERSTYPNLEVVIVENNSEDPRTFAHYDDLTARDARVRVTTWEPPEPGAFNYSAIVNHGAAEARGEVLLLLNNDTEVIAPDWIEEMLGCLMRPEVGVVGAKLLFGDGLIQHVGMAANPNGDNCHLCQNLTATALGPNCAAALPGDYHMVTGACQMVRHALFEELGGYDEELAVGFNDGDFCLRAGERGYAVTVAAHALLHHREFSTRGREITDARLRQRFLQEKARIMQRHASFYAEGDSALNPNTNPFSSYFELGW